MYKRQLQTIASRNVDPLKQVVVSVCTVATDSTAHNVIPQVVKMKGTVRTMDFAVQDFVEKRIGEIVQGTAMALGARAEVHYEMCIRDRMRFRPLSGCAC